MLCLTVSLASITHWYTFTDQDYDVIDLVEQKLFDMMDAKDRSGEFMIDALNKFAAKRTFNDKQQAIFDLLVDDIEYYYGDDEVTDDAEWTMTAEDCYENEIFDEEDQWCYPSDDMEGEDFSSDESNEDKEHDEELKVIATYSINDDMITLKDWEMTDLHAMVWEMFSSITPKETRPFLVEAGFADDADNNTDAFVAQTDIADQWKIVFNIASFQWEDTDADRKQEIMVHEYAHLVSYWPSQVNYIPMDTDDDARARYAEKCETYFVWEWCLHDDAYLLSFINKFWTADELEITEVNGEPDEYSPEEYVSEYAGTNHGEDFAESFAYFVTKTKPTTTINEADQKIAFFYDFDDLVKLRTLIRSRLTK